MLQQIQGDIRCTLVIDRKARHDSRVTQQFPNKAAILGLPEHDAALATAGKKAVRPTIREVKDTFAVVLDFVHHAITIDIKYVDLRVHTGRHKPDLFDVLHLNHCIFM